MAEKKFLRKTLHGFKRGFIPIIAPGQWKTPQERQALIDKIIGYKKFPLKELLEVLGQAYTIRNKKEKAELLKIIEDILLKARHPDTSRALLGLFKSTVDPAIRDATIRILQKLGDRKIIPSVITLLRSPKQKFRRYAFKLLDSFDASEVSKQLSAELLTGEWPDRVEPLNYLFQIDRDAVIIPCRKALEIGNESDKIGALKILSAIDSPEAARAMEYVLDDESVNIRMQVAKAYSKFRSAFSVRNLIKLVNDPRPDVIMTALDGLQTLKFPAAIPAVVRCFSNDNMSVRIKAISVLGEIGTADEVEYLTEALKDKDIRIRQAALDALVTLSQNSETDIAKFITILMSDADVNVRRAAAQILGQVDAPSIFEKLFEYLRDEDWWVRETIAETLSKIKDDRIFPAAVDLLSNTDPSLRRYAIDILVSLNDPRALVMMIKMLKDSDWWVRERAVTALGEMKAKEVVPILTDLLTIKELLYVTAEALGEIGDPTAVQPLLKVLDKGDVETTIAIIDALEKLQAQEAIPEIEKLIVHPVREIRFKAKEVLTRLKVDTKKLDKISARWWEKHEFSLLDTLLLEVKYQKGTDLFLISNNPPMARINGEMVLLSKESLSEEHIMMMASQILSPDQENKFIATNDLDFSHEIADEGRFRGNMFRHAHGVNMVFRLLPDEVPDLRSLNLPEYVDTLARLYNGLVLVTGPSACGKSTTLAAIINEINEIRNDHIITIEDPIEYIHTRKKSLVTQREVGRHTNSFARALRAALREDPDVILVGELRDLETISMALTAAETGHLVFATLHSMSATKAIDRIIDVYPASRQGQIRTMLAESLKTIISQQLIPRKDGKGHVVAMEILINTSAVAALIRGKKLFQIPSMITAGQQYGMISMDQSLLKLLQDDVITEEDAYLRAEDRNQFESYRNSFQR